MKNDTKRQTTIFNNGSSQTTILPETQKFQEEMDHFLSRINYATSFLDARAITFMNEWTKMLLRMQKNEYEK